MLFFSVGLDCVIAFWDITAPDHFESRHGYHHLHHHHLTDEGPHDRHLIGIHGGHKLFSSSYDFHGKQPATSKQDSDQSDDLSETPHNTGGIINDVNWLRFELPDPSNERSIQPSIQGVTKPALGLAVGGSSFGTALLTCVSVDDNNLLQVI